MAGEGRIGYLLKAFPVVSETFILNEIRAMERHGVPLAIVALKTPPPTVRHESVGDVESPVARASRPWRKTAFAHVRFAVLSGAAYWPLLRRQVARPLGRWLARPGSEQATLLRKKVRRFNWAVGAARRVEALDIRHLHAHYAGEPLRVAHLIRKLTGIPYSFTAHAKDLYLAPARRLARRLQTAEFAIACHRHGLDTLREHLPPEDRDRVQLIRHGIDTTLFTPAAIESEAIPRILAVGRLTEKKGLDDLIAACSRLPAELSWRCDIVGDGRQRNALARQIEALGLNNRIRIHGFVPQQELPLWYRRAAAVVMPSRVLADGNRDGVPNVLLEAMACAAPIIAAPRAGILEWIEPSTTGLIAPSGNPEALATQLERLLTDRELGCRIGSAAAARVRELDYQRTNLPLAERFMEQLEAPVDEALAAADRAGWGERGLARKARKRLGVRPQRREWIEAGIQRAIRPGLRANAWRPDLHRLAGRRLWDEAIKGNRLDRLLPLLTGGRDDAAVLDLGSGRGGLSVALRARGLSTTAVDLRFRNCAVARLRGLRYGLDCRALNAVAETLPFADSSFDAIACLEVLEHVQDPEAVLGEMRRVLKPGGRCVATVINRWAHVDPHYHLWGINFLPRPLAMRYIAWRRRSKLSYRDRQALDEMHYYTYRDFVRTAARLGFRVAPPPVEGGVRARLRRHLALRLSLGFNTLTVLLEPIPAAQPRTLPGDEIETVGTSTERSPARLGAR